MQMGDTRKTRLSLKQINKARKAGEFHKDEQEKELVFVNKADNSEIGLGVNFYNEDK